MTQTVVKHRESKKNRKRKQKFSASLWLSSTEVKLVSALGGSRESGSGDEEKWGEI